LSIIDDPDKVGKVIEALEQLRRGASLRSALEAAGLSRTELEELIAEAIEALEQYRRRGSSLVAYCDGASRGNPGEAASAVVICDDEGKVIHRTSRLLGVTTNNVAEYQAVILALERARKLGADRLTLKVDSELVANQLQDNFRVKNAKLKELHRRAKELMAGFKEVAIHLIRREENREADRMANKALDRLGPGGRPG